MDYFTIASGEEYRLDEGLKNRGLTSKDVVSISWNSIRCCYVVWYNDKEEAYFRYERDPRSTARIIQGPKLDALE